MRGIIRIGDATSHGGRIIVGSACSKVMGRQVARLGDACNCPIKGHSGGVIAEGHPNFIVAACRWLSMVTRPPAAPR